MKKLMVLLLMFAGLTSCFATCIDIRKEGATHHSGTRMPSTTKITADIESGVITLQLTGYTGGMQVYIYDSEDNIVGYTISNVIGREAVTLALGIRSGDSYSLSIVLDNTTYYGHFCS